jgi:hypothetical protein
MVGMLHEQTSRDEWLLLRFPDLLQKLAVIA